MSCIWKPIKTCSVWKNEWMHEWMTQLMFASICCKSSGLLSYFFKLFIYFTLHHYIGFAIHWLESVVVCFNSQCAPDCWAVLRELSLQPEMGVERQKLKPNSREWKYSRYFLSGQNLMIFPQPSLDVHNSSRFCGSGALCLHYHIKAREQS